MAWKSIEALLPKTVYLEISMTILTFPLLLDHRILLYYSLTLNHI